MAFTMTNHGLFHLLTKAMSSTGTTASVDDIRMAVYTGTYPSVATIRTMNFLSDVATAGMTEAVAGGTPPTTGYSRQDLALTITENDSGVNTVTITATAPVLNTVAAGQTYSAVAYYIHNAGADSTKELIGLDQPTPTTIATNGQNVTLPALLITISGS